MAISVTVSSAQKQPSGKYYVRFSDGVELEFNSLEKMKQHVRAFRDDTATDFIRAMAIAKYLKSDPTGSNPGALVGRTMTIDLSLARNIVQVT